MSELIINFKNSNSIKFLIETTKETGFVAVKDFITLQKGKIYYLPIANKELNLKDFTFCKINPDLIDYIDVRNINNGLATVTARVHNYQIIDGTHLGDLI